MAKFKILNEETGIWDVMATEDQVSGVQTNLDNHKQDNINQTTQQLINYENEKPHIPITGYQKRIETYDNIVSLPNNTKGQVSVTLKGLTATNLVRNGNFANGATDWTTVGGSIAINDGVATLTGSGSYNFVYANQNLGAFKANHEYYLACRLKPVSNKITLLQMSLTPSGGGGSLFLQRELFEYGAWNFISGVVTSSVAQLGDILVRPRFNFSSAEDAVNQTGEIDDCFVVDLTATFGAGNEPTKDECDKIFPHWFDGTKSTVGACRVKSAGKNLFSGWELGRLDGTTGNPTESVNHLRTKDFIKVEGGTSYTVTDPENISSQSANAQFVYEYDINKNFLGRYALAPKPSATFVTQPNTEYVKIGSQQVGINNFVIGDYRNFKTQLEKGTVATPYEPHKANYQYVIAKDSEGKIAELRSLPNGAKDEINVGEKKAIIRNGKVVLNGIENWTGYSTDSNGNLFMRVENWQTTNNSIEFNGSNLGAQAFNSDFQVAVSTVSGLAPKIYISSGRLYLFLPPTTGITDATSFKAYLQNKPITLIYQLSTPIISDIETHGEIVAYPNGTIYCEPCQWGFTSNSVNVLEYPIKAINKVIRYEIEKGKLKEIDVTANCSFTGNTLTIGNIDTSKTYFYDVDFPEELTTSGEKIFDVEVDNGVITKDFKATATAWTLDSNESKATMLICNNAGGATQIIAPAKDGKMYIIRNTSGQNITIKTVSTTGVVVANNKTVTVMFMGTDFIKIGEV